MPPIFRRAHNTSAAGKTNSPRESDLAVARRPMASSQGRHEMGQRVGIQSARHVRVVADDGLRVTSGAMGLAGNPSGRQPCGMNQIRSLSTHRGASQASRHRSRHTCRLAHSGFQLFKGLVRP